MLLGALRMDTLLRYMTDMQRRFLLAVLPDSWAVPKFIPSASSELEQVQRFLKDLTARAGAPNPSAVLIELAETGKLSLLLQQNPNLPAALRDLIAACVGPLRGPFSVSLPSLDFIDLNAVTQLFKLPTELEYPVSPEGLSLFIPVVVKRQAAAAATAAAAAAAEGPKTGDSSLLANITDIYIPVVSHQGDILFADAFTILKGVHLPARLPLQPLATFSAYQVLQTLNPKP